MSGSMSCAVRAPRARWISSSWSCGITLSARPSNIRSSSVPSAPCGTCRSSDVLPDAHVQQRVAEAQVEQRAAPTLDAGRIGLLRAFAAASSRLVGCTRSGRGGAAPGARCGALDLDDANAVLDGDRRERPYDAMCGYDVDQALDAVDVVCPAAARGVNRLIKRHAGLVDAELGRLDRDEQPALDVVENQPTIAQHQFRELLFVQQVAGECMVLRRGRGRDAARRARARRRTSSQDRGTCPIDRRALLAADGSSGRFLRRMRAG